MSKPIALIALRNSLLSMEPERSTSHARNKSTTRSDERARASLSDHCRYSALSTCPLPSSSSALKRLRRSASLCSPFSRSRMRAQNSSKSSLPSLSASAASRSKALLRMPSSNFSSPVPATSSPSRGSAAGKCPADNDAVLAEGVISCAYEPREPRRGELPGA